ncbi:malate dehydrogenase, mitochondrial [Tanacetum coccineum]
MILASILVCILNDLDCDHDLAGKSCTSKEPAAATTPKKAESSSDESSEDDSSDEEEEPRRRRLSEDESSEEESFKDEPAKLQAIKKAAAKKDSSSDEEESSEKESSDEYKEPKTAKKNTDVEMVDASSAKKAPQTPATPHATRTKTIFMGNLSFSIEENDIINFFKDVGEVAEVCFAMRDERFAGYGHVEFTTPNAAQKAIELNGSYLLGLTRRVGVKDKGYPYLLGDLEKIMILIVLGLLLRFLLLILLIAMVSTRLLNLVELRNVSKRLDSELQSSNKQHIELVEQCESLKKGRGDSICWMHEKSNPVNSTVPIPSVVFKKACTYDERRLFGVTTLDVVRANTFYAGKAKVGDAGIIGGSINSYKAVNVPVVGGHAGITILPLFSQATPKPNLSNEEITALTKQTRDGGTKVVEVKAKKGSATLSMAYIRLLFVKGTRNPTKILSNLNELAGCEQNEEIQVFGAVCRLSLFSTSVMVLCSLGRLSL